jgi:alpha-beta hydrolase superfamily lysophospholipase
MNQRLKHWIIGEWSLWRIVRSLLEVYIVLLVFALFFSDRLIFRPQSPSYTASKHIYRIPVNDREQIAVLELISTNADLVVLHAHGNAEDLGSIQFVMEEFRDKGFTVYAFDYRGYGISDGRASARNACEDAEALYLHLVNERSIVPERIIAHGRSVGAAIAIDLASKHRLGGLVVEGGFVTAFRVTTYIPLFPFDVLRNNAKMPKVNAPVLVMHGDADRTIPVWHGKQLYALAPEPKLSHWVPNAGHDDLMIVDEAGYWNSWSRFVELLMPRDNQ